MLILTIIIVVLAIVLLVFCPISFDVKFYLNPIENKNVVLIKVLFFSFFVLIEISDGKIIITNKKGERKELVFSALSGFQKAFFKNVLKRIDVKKGFVVFKGGVKDDAFKTSMMCGAVLSAFNMLKIYLKNKKNLTINFNIDTNYKQDVLTIGADLSFQISIFSVLISAISGKIKSKGEVNGKRAKSNSKHSSKHAF